MDGTDWIVRYRYALGLMQQTNWYVVVTAPALVLMPALVFQVLQMMDSVRILYALG